MERLGSIDEMKARLEKLRARSVNEHLERMASLPAGTCERCYGTKTVHAGPMQWIGCPDCTDAAQVHADGVPYEFHHATFANFAVLSGNTTALKKAEAFTSAKDTRDLFLTGGVGAGKTRLACSVVNEAKRRGAWCLFARVPMLLHQLQPGHDGAADLEHRLMRCDLVVLDDVGAERDQASDYTRRTLLMIYEERGDRGLRTIFTSNKTLQQLAEMQDDDRLASRIAGRADVVQLTTADQRLAHRKR